MSTRLKPYSLSAEPDLFDRVLELADQQAIREKSNRSAVLRQILYSHFGIIDTREIKPLNCARIIKSRKS